MSDQTTVRSLTNVLGKRSVRMAMLNTMADLDVNASIARQASWGIRDLDLKDGIFGKAVLDLDDTEAAAVIASARDHGMTVHCLSTSLFFDDVELGEERFRMHHLARIDRAIAIARIMRPRLVRLLAARSSRPRPLGENAIERLDRDHPWLVGMYAEAIDRLHAAGFGSTIENEVHGCVLSTPDEVLALFARLGRRDRLCFTWDVQNLWEQGTFPTVAVYERLRPLIGYYHLKGGRSESVGDGAGEPLVWNCGLADASWPVIELTQRVARDGVSPVMCLNPSHGKRIDGYDYADAAWRDLVYLRGAVAEIG